MFGSECSVEKAKPKIVLNEVIMKTFIEEKRRMWR